MPLALPTLLLCLPAFQAPAPVSPSQAVVDAARAKAKSVAEARAAFVKSGGNTKDFKGDCVKELAALEARLAAEKRPEVRQALLVSRLFHLQLAKGAPTAAQLEQTLREVPPTSAFWTLDAGLLTARAEKDPQTWGPYVAEARAKHPDAGLRRTLLFEQFLGRLDAGDEAGWQAAMADIKAQFPPLAERAQAFLDAEAKTAPGKPAPAFTVKALGEANVTYTLDSFKGRYLFIDFWATWCPDCRAELPALHAAWAKHQSARLDFLSLSFDRRIEHIAPFRQQAATPMPWKHAFIDGGFQSPLAEAFGVKSIPKALLIGPDGKIVASGAQLRGANLEKTLAKILGN
ncbi:MAG: TlpA family protein disulfide reductase [Acidobacteria bacterium]|nr:TlpA family protein disulfide reductase [Acidobacteriota bacterium]MBI3489612.1 TlpA family protein disulfide reductase [Acidobacteriota bacterium]